MIRFAGFDPDEDDFEGVEPAPLHAHDRRVTRGAIDPEAALQIKLAGNTWRRVGEIMACEQNRVIRFSGDAC